MRRAKEDVTKLPQWAQDKIKREEADAAYWREKAGEAYANVTTHTYIKGFTDPNTCLPEEPVTFCLGLDKWDRPIEITIYHAGERLELNAHGSALLVHPLAANHLAVSTDATRPDKPTK